MVSSIGCETGVVNVHDSIYEEIDSNTQEVVFNIFGTVDINFVQVQKQRGGSDCGLFAIAISIAICNGLDPSRIRYDQTSMRSHLVDCFKNETMTII